MKSTRKGDIGTSKVLSRALELGYPVYLPFSEDNGVDLVVQRHGKLERVQCKATISDGVVIKAKTSSTSSWANKTKSIKKYTADEIDWLAVYDFTSDECYFINAILLDDGRNCFNLRLKPTKNNQSKHILWAKDFMEW